MIMSNVKKLLMLSVLLSPSAVFAAEGTIDGPATVWLMVSIVIVLLMFIPGLALFYGGMVRAKNILSLFTQFFAIAGIVGILWVAGVN